MVAWSTIPAPMPPYFSVVVPTHNRLNMLREVLRALGDQTGAPEIEVIVIDDGSTDGTAAALEAHHPSYPFTFRSQPNGGPGRARNHGVSLAKGRFVVFIGDDTVPERDFLAEHARVHRDCMRHRFRAPRVRDHGRSQS